MEGTYSLLDLHQKDGMDAPDQKFSNTDGNVLNHQEAGSSVPKEIIFTSGESAFLHQL